MKIFLSAVSAQFKACRDQLASDLRAIGCEVKVQEDFQQHGRALLEKLEAYIAECDRVIAIVGDAYGYEPDEGARPANRLRRSYTQWEYFLARGERLGGNDQRPKDIFVYLASPQYLASHPVEQPAEVAWLQHQFVQIICDSGKDRSQFDAPDQLCRLVLRDGWQIQHRPRKPIALPYPTLGTLFKGRDDFMAQLRKSLQKCGERRATAIVGRALHGLGGVGKTRLAVEYAWQHVADYSAVLFVLADSPQNLRRNLAGLVGPLVLDLPEKNAIEEEVRIASALSWLNDHRDWFLILDNVDTEETATEAEQLLARLHGGQVLITSRLGRWSGSVEPLELDVIQIEDSAQFLLERTERARQKRPADEADATELAGELDRLALALEQAGAYIVRRRMAISDYLRLWRAQEPAVRQWHDERLMKYPRSLAVTWQTSFDQLRPGEIALLRLLAWFAPDSIPIFVLESGEARTVYRDAVELCETQFHSAPDRLESCHSPSDNILDALATLADYSMLRWDTTEQSVTIHRLVQEILRKETVRSQVQAVASDRFNKDEQSRWAGLAARLVNNSFPRGEPFENWKACSLLLPHALAIKEAFLLYGMEPVTIGRLLCEAASYLRQRYQLDDAEPLCQLSLQIREEAVGSDHEDVGDSVYQLAWVKQRKKLLREAIPFYEWALDIYERTVGKESAKYADVMDNLGVLYDDLGNHENAEQCYLECLAIRTRVFGEDSFDVATTKNNLGTSYQDREEFDKAQDMYEEALGICSRINKLNDPKAAIFMSNLAARYEHRDRLDDAQRFRQQALEVRTSALGHADQESLEAFYALLELHIRKRELETAMLACNAYLSAARDQVGPEHPCIATVLCLEADLAGRLGQNADVEKAYRNALMILEKTPVSKSRQIADVCAKLANFYYERGDYAAAEPLDRRIMEINERTLPADHFDVATSWFNYAVTLRNMGRAPEAERHLRHALTLAERAPEAIPRASGVIPHWHTHLATILLVQNKLPEAIDILRECWINQQNTRDVTTARVVFLRYAIARIQGDVGATSLGQLKTLLDGKTLPVPAGVSHIWRVPTVLAHFRERLPGDTDLLVNLLAAVDNCAHTVALDVFPTWRDQPPVRLDTPWPG